MPSRRDQLQSYQFLTQRVISAFVMRETDPAQSPLRRGIGALFGGLMAALIVAAVFGIYGVLTRVGGTQWKTDGAVVVERETGATFVYAGSRLNPTLNIASAKLAAGRPNPVVHRVAAKSLAGVPRGVMIGIAGAPASLPSADRRVGLPWTICSVPDRDAAGNPVSRVVLVVAESPSGEQRVGDRGILVKDAELGPTYLLWHGRRHLVQDARTSVPALFGEVPVTPVGTAWLSGLPTGADIASFSVPDRGAPSPAAPEHAIGDILVAPTASGPQYYLVLDDGLAPITPLQQAMLRTRHPGEPVGVTVAEATSIPPSVRLPPAAGAAQPPPAPPELVHPGPADLICAVTTASGASPDLTVGGETAGLERAVPTRAVEESGAPLADAVLVPAGRVAIVRSRESAGYSIVTDVGVRHAVTAADVLPLLGYSRDHAVEVPAELLTRIPVGPTLDPAAATQPAGTAADGTTG
jgi:type VII secretion protein EccB